MATIEPRPPMVPALVGGIPTKQDFAPSIIFAIAYGLALIPVIWRFRNPNTRTILFTFGTLSFSIERIVVWSIRASQSHDHQPGETLKKGFLIYQQVSFALGFLGFSGDTTNWLRTTLVNSTLADPVRGSVDNPERRFWARRWADIWGLVWLTATVTGGVAHSGYTHADTDQSAADKLFRLRYVSSGVGLALIVLYIVQILYLKRRKIEFLDHKALNFCIFYSMGLAVIPIYRLSVMYHKTTFLNVLPTPPSPLYPADSLTTTASKATFYIFHALPEYLLCLTVQTANLRKIFNTGMWGDWAGSDRPGIPRLRVDGVLVDGVGVKRGKVGSGPQRSIVGTITGRYKAKKTPSTHQLQDASPSQDATA